MSRWAKWVLGFSVAITGLALGGMIFLIVDFGGSDKLQTIEQAKSTDGQAMAEILKVVTPMHGGP